MGKDLVEKRKSFENALATFVNRLKEDKWILAAVLIGSISDQTIWRKESIGMWIIETDGVTKRRKSDGQEERLFRTFIEDDINIHAEIIPRARFKRMIEGASRTAFTHNFFAKRTLLYTTDESIERWFYDANTLATKDQDTALLIATTWVISPLKYIKKLIDIKEDIELARQELTGVAYSLAAIEIILRGEVCEQQIIYKALEYKPDFFKIVYSDLLKPQKSVNKLQKALGTIGSYLDENWESYLKPVIKYLKKHRRMVSLSEMADEFAHTQIYPWHILTSCDWLAEKGIVEKFSAPLKMTVKSRVEIEEPAYQYMA